MNISELFIRRPIMTGLVMAAILIFGIFAYRLLPVSDLPNVDFPTIQVGAGVPGASPETMASSVATPLEKQFSTIAGIDSMTSSNSLGSTSITLQFDLSRSLDGAALDVQSAISQAQRQLPPEMPSPPSFRKVNPADSPILYMALSSPDLALPQIDEAAETTFAQRISMVSGVAQVSVFGSQKYAVRVQVNPDKLAATQVGIDDVANAIRAGNTNTPTGTLYGQAKTFTIQSNGQLTDAAQFRNLVVAYRNGAPVRLGDLGDVIDSVQDIHNLGWYNGNPAITLAVFRQPGTNTVEVVDNVKKLLPSLQQQIPASIKIDILHDHSDTIRASVDDVKFTLLLTIALVIMVIFLFLRNISATIIPSIAVPMSIIGTFSVMYLLDYSLDNLSLMALTLSVGFVVDDAIVMLENIVRHMEMGKAPFRAAIDGSREIGFTIVSMTLSLAAVFIPLLFMGGVIGRLLHEFAVTIGVAILVSGFVSLTLTPMLCSRFLKSSSHGAHSRHGRFYNVTERIFESGLQGYEWSLKKVLDHRLATLIVSLALIAGTVFLYMAVHTGFIPDEDQGLVVVSTEANQGIAFDQMVQLQKQVDDIIRQDPNVQASMMSIGNPLNQGRVYFRLKDVQDRVDHKSVFDVIQELRPKLAHIPGINVYMQVPPTIRIGGMMTKSAYQYTIQSPNTAELYEAAPKFLAALSKSTLLQDVTSDLQLKNPQLRVQVDRDAAYAKGVTPDQVLTALYSAYGSRQVSTIYTPTNEYYVILELQPKFWQVPQDLSQLYIRSNTNNNTLVPLSSVAKLVQDVGPLTVNHLGQLPAVTLSFNLRPGVSLGDATRVVQQIAATTLPPDIQGSFQGTAQAFEASFAGLGILLAAAIIVIYIILGILYESLVHPLTILSGLPSAGVGALLTLIIFRQELNLYSFVGIIMLIGIVKKNAIMMIDFALEAERKEGKPPEEAIYQGALVRFRPIMMTTMAAFMGTLPIAVGWGAGAASRRGLGLAVVGGLVFSQVVTLYITPVYYVYLDKVQNKWKEWRAGKKRALPEAEEEALVGANGRSIV
ncbi:MAG TPA: efflux RND transporter permease subunit [Terriglobales bacterium]|nr:efflux RND transporter permease subunit [Terriglobales bacterium]